MNHPPDAALATAPASASHRPGLPSRDPGRQARDLALGGMLLALAVLVPILFHAVGWAGKVFLPMHLPVLMAGLLLPPGIAAAVGFLAPLTSAALTGMPPLVPFALLMAPELATLAAVASVVYVRARPLRGGVWLALLAAMVAGRCVTSLEILAVAPLLGFHKSVFAYVILGAATGTPGLILQLTVVPAAMRALERAEVSR